MTKEKIRKIYLIILAVYIALATSFYFIAGEQLWYKDSKNSIGMPEANAVTQEINENTTIKQSFSNSIDRLDKFAFVFTKNYQEGNGQLTITIRLNGNEILKKTYDVKKDIQEQRRMNIEFETPITDAAGKRISITLSSTSKEGKGVRAMMVGSQEDSSFFVTQTKKELVENTTDQYKETTISKEVPGTLCFSLNGSDNVILGKYYLPIFGGIGLLLASYLLISYLCFANGRNDYLITAILALNRYKFLISQLVSRDFKTKYKRSVFGILWSFLNPLLTMIVQFLVFSTIFKVDTQNYPVYLISGVVCFSFFNECTTMCLGSISGNYRLITKVYIPKYIFPLSKTISSSVNLAISLIPLLLVTLITGVALNWSFLLMFYFLACLIIFSLGVGMILATLMVFFRDIQFIWSVLLTIWQYATPIFYPAEIIPEKYRFIIKLNPLYHFIGNARKCLIDGISPEPVSYLYCLLFALGALLIGSIIFKKNQDKFTLYL